MNLGFLTRLARPARTTPETRRQTRADRAADNARREAESHRTRQHLADARLRLDRLAARVDESTRTAATAARTPRTN